LRLRILEELAVEVVAPGALGHRRPDHLLRVHAGVVEPDVRPVHDDPVARRLEEAHLEAVGSRLADAPAPGSLVPEQRHDEMLREVRAERVDGPVARRGLLDDPDAAIRVPAGLRARAGRQRGEEPGRGGREPCGHPDPAPGPPHAPTPRLPQIRSSSSIPMSTSRPFEPSAGPSTPASWSWSTIRAARP